MIIQWFKCSLFRVETSYSYLVTQVWLAFGCYFILIDIEKLYNHISVVFMHIIFFFLCSLLWNLFYLQVRFWFRLILHTKMIINLFVLWLSKWKLLDRAMIFYWILFRLYLKSRSTAIKSTQRRRKEPTEVKCLSSYHCPRKYFENGVLVMYC